MDKRVEFYRKIFKKNESQLEKLYFDFLRFPTMSADHTFRPKLKACAEWLKTFLEKLGFTVELWTKKDAPIVYATHCTAGKDKPTLLLYNHYDVQPVDPIELWESDPFTPRKVKNSIFARGAQDNKGQCFYVLAALKALVETHKKLPINIKLCIEGEEESGSKELQELLNKKKKELKADYLMIVDLGMPDEKTPAITLGTRGLTAFTIEAEGTNTDLHSGSHGGLAYNPLRALVEVLAKLRDEKGKIRIPHFYDDVVMPTRQDLKNVDLTFNQKAYTQEFGTPATGGEQAFSPKERFWFRPTLEINGIHGGYGGPGTKTVIPAKAIAKLSCRLVPHQDPQKIAQLVQQYIESLAPKGIKITCTIEDSFGESVRTPTNSPIISALSAACSTVYKKPCTYIYEGASIPVTANLAKASGAEVAMFGLGLASDKIHAPNEHFGWDRVEKGSIIMALVIENLVP